MSVIQLKTGGEAVRKILMQEPVETSTRQQQRCIFVLQRWCVLGGGIVQLYFFFLQVNVAGKTVLVIGSQTPWLEVVLLARQVGGASVSVENVLHCQISRSPKEIITFEYIFPNIFENVIECEVSRSPKEIVTLEYGNFKSEHPLWSFIRWQEESKKQ